MLNLRKERNPRLPSKSKSLMRDDFNETGAGKTPKTPSARSSRFVPTASQTAKIDSHEVKRDRSDAEREFDDVMLRFKAVLKDPPKALPAIAAKDTFQNIQKRMEKILVVKYLPQCKDVPIEDRAVVFLHCLLETLPKAVPSQMAELIPLFSQVSTSIKRALEAKFPIMGQQSSANMIDLQNKAKLEALDRAIEDAANLEKWYDRMQPILVKSEEEQNKSVIATIIHEPQGLSSKLISDDELCKLSTEINWEIENKIDRVYKQVRGC